MSMTVTIITPDQISTLALPSKIGGRYWLSVRDAAGRSFDAASVEGAQSQWVLRSSTFLVLLDANRREVEDVPLTGERMVINGRSRQEGSGIRFYIEPSTEDRRTYRKYCVQGDCRLNIGRAPDNQIVFDNKYVSSHHAILIREGKNWSITDTQSSNGTFVNAHRTATKQLFPGDVVYIMGLKLITGDGFLALNDPDGAVSVASGHLAALAPQPLETAPSICRSEPVPEVYQSSPRMRRGVERGSITVDPPPPVQRLEETPMALLLGPALTMGLTAVVMAAVAAINLMNGTSTMLTALPTIIMSFSMLCGTLLWPLLAKRSEKRKAGRAEQKRQNTYREYLTQIRSELHAMGERQKAILLENYPSAGECERRALDRERSLWERSADQGDFLTLRLGLGEVPLNAEVKFPESRFSVDADPLRNEVNRLRETPMLLSDAPIICSLRKAVLVGAAGPARQTEAFLKSLITQIVTLHCCDEVRLVFFIDEAEQDAWDAYRFLPHVCDENAGLRCFAVTAEEEKAAALYLERVWAERETQRDSRAGRPLPWYILIAPDPTAAERIPLLSRLDEQAERLGFAGITAACGVDLLPKMCSAVIELKETEAVLYDRKDSTAARVIFHAEYSDPDREHELCMVLGNLALHTQAEKYALPSMLTFLEMYGAGRTEHLNALDRWKENSPVNTLQAPVGVGTNGELLYLDLHEKAHGPHGLIAGMTGSGKSEFVITYILSMAVNYHPDEVSFILIDYKGGGLAGAFEDTQNGVRLPHLAGTITNLDGTAVKRALISLQSELRRRQTIFNEAKKAADEGTMDIYKYQKLYRSGIVSEPVPHLFVVSDEFAELKAQQPDFMAQLISTARIGRSLGVHLILATQKPTGVVDDQIWSNSRFRVCLKVQERADSMELLKRPDAAELKDTGRFYLQVGFNELFEQGQSAWCGAPYVPVDRVTRKQDDRVEVVDHLGRVQFETRLKAAGAASETSQVVSIVKYLSALADAEHISARRLWLPPLPAFIYLNDLIQKYHWKPDPLALEPVIGEYDDPFNQSQELLTIPFFRKGNALIYGAVGSGKTALLNTVLACLLQTYSAEQLNVYIVDLGEETLRAFAGAPQVGDVLLSSDEEKIRSLFKMLRSEIAARKKHFAEGDGSYAGHCSSRGEAVPQMLVILRNYSAFLEQFEDLDDQLIQITRECSKYGIYFMVTANAANAVRYRAAQNFGILYALQLNDDSDYIGLFGGTGGIYPSKIKGRGLFKTDRVYEFQTAHFAPERSQNALRELVDRLPREGGRARPVPTLPECVVPSFFSADYAPQAVPVGVEKASLRTAVWDFSRFVISPVVSQNMEELGATAQGIAEQLSRLDGAVTVLDGAELLDRSCPMDYKFLHSGFSGCVGALFREMVRRNNTYKKAAAAGHPTEAYAAEYFVITGLQTILAGLSDAERDQFNTLLEKAELPYNIRFILCSDVKSFAGFSGTMWYSRHISGSDGIWVGDGIADQYSLKVGRLTNSLYSELPPHFGYLVRRGKPTLAKLIVGEHCEEDEQR